MSRYSERDRRRRYLAAWKASRGCTDCGLYLEDLRAVHPDRPQRWHLDLDHIDPATKGRERRAYDDRGRAVSTSWAWSRLLAELRLVEPVCKRCHGIRTKVQRLQQQACHTEPEPQESALSAIAA